MAKLKMLFDVPKWVEMGLREGSLKTSGGVVRDDAGRIVHILRESAERASRSRNPYVLAGLAAAAIAVIVYSVYSRNKKERESETTSQPSSEFPTIDPDVFEKAIDTYWRVRGTNDYLSMR